jgi:hypothetical protein
VVVNWRRISCVKFGTVLVLFFGVFIVHLTMALFSLIYYLLSNTQ